MYTYDTRVYKRREYLHGRFVHWRVLYEKQDTM